MAPDACHPWSPVFGGVPVPLKRTLPQGSTSSSRAGTGSAGAPAAARRGGPPAAAPAPRLTIGRAAWTVTYSLIHPGVYAAAGLDPVRTRAAAWRNPAFRETLRWSAERVTTYLQELGLVAGPARRLWRSSALL
ncbi:diiron oxygenase [Dactylosporangium sp. NPDC005555]|uniref:diiron oxygenase n=1 Tax=Dactylosporangium sp. NPDC005555 TaxID=3154889 RepID=UPI0033AE9D2E